MKQTMLTTDSADDMLSLPHADSEHSAPVTESVLSLDDLLALLAMPSSEAVDQERIATALRAISW